MLRELLVSVGSRTLSDSAGANGGGYFHLLQAILGRIRALHGSVLRLSYQILSLV